MTDEMTKAEQKSRVDAMRDRIGEIKKTLPSVDEAMTPEAYAQAWAELAEEYLRALAKAGLLLRFARHHPDFLVPDGGKDMVASAKAWLEMCNYEVTKRP